MKEFERPISALKKHRNILLFVCDVATVPIMCFIATLIKFDAPSLFNAWFTDGGFYIMAVDAVSTAVFFTLFKMYGKNRRRFDVSECGKTAVPFVISKIGTAIFTLCVPQMFGGATTQTRPFVTWLILYSCLYFAVILLYRAVIFSDTEKPNIPEKGGVNEGETTNAEINGDGKSTDSNIKVDYAGLLGREHIKHDLAKVYDLLKGQTVFVSGGGGSIGGEIVRQIAKSGVAETIIVFDIAENGTYEIQREINRDYPEVDLKILIGSVRDEKRLCEIFEKYRPSIVYHAAAHKHVPLMEDSPKEAVKNNVLGTFNLAKTADRYGVKKFVLISTDKAVEPTNVMGATKSICEMIVFALNKKSDTQYLAVRFGNVMGTSGSVIPVFKDQIKKGGPVTVTHPDMARYFILIHDVASLILQAGALSNGGEVFILDMGEPVKIRELAENLIRLCGHIPDGDIKIHYTGLREGENLCEKLPVGKEDIQKTENGLISVAMPEDFDADAFLEKIENMRYAVENATDTETVAMIKQIVPAFKSGNTEFSEEENGEEIFGRKEEILV